MANVPETPTERQLLMTLAAILIVFIVVEVVRTANLLVTRHDDPVLSGAVQGMLVAVVLAVSGVLAKLVGK